MPAADNVEGRGLSSGVARVFPVRSGGASSFGCLQIVRGAHGAQRDVCLPGRALTGVLRTGLRGLATRVIPTRKNLRWVIVLLISALGVDIFKLLHHP